MLLRIRWLLCVDYLNCVVLLFILLQERLGHQGYVWVFRLEDYRYILNSFKQVGLADSAV